MSARAKYFTTLIGGTVLLLVIFRVFLPFYNKYHSYLHIVKKEGGMIHVEYKPNLFDLKKFMEDKNLKGRRGIEADFNRKLKTLKQCTTQSYIRGIRGDLDKFLVVSGYCIARE